METWVIKFFLLLIWFLFNFFHNQYIPFIFNFFQIISSYKFFIRKSYHSFWCISNTLIWTVILTWIFIKISQIISLLLSFFWETPLLSAASGGMLRLSYENAVTSTGCTQAPQIHHNSPLFPYPTQICHYSDSWVLAGPHTQLTKLATLRFLDYFFVILHIYYIHSSIHHWTNI